MKFTSVNDPHVTLQEAKEDKQGFKKIDFIRQRLTAEVGDSKMTDVYEAATRYPFRAGAAKAVVGLTSQPCEKSPLSPFSVSYFLYFIFNYKFIGNEYFKNKNKKKKFFFFFAATRPEIPFAS